MKKLNFQGFLFFVTYIFFPPTPSNLSYLIFRQVKDSRNYAEVVVTFLLIKGVARIWREEEKNFS